MLSLIHISMFRVDESISVKISEGEESVKYERICYIYKREQIIKKVSEIAWSVAGYSEVNIE